jgi:arylsulfatase A-like enzyme
MYPHNTNVFNSAGGLESFRERASKWSIGVRLQAAGYTTAFIGKYLNGYELDPSYVPPGWDEWFGLAGRDFVSGYSYEANHNGTMEQFGDGDEDYQTDVLARQANAFVDRAAGDDPFLLTLFPSAPHAPIEPARRHRDNDFVDDVVPERPNFDEDLAEKPTWLRERREWSDRQEQDSLRRYRDGLGSLIAVDDMLEGIAARLEATGELEDTVFVFTSDNGYSFGSHRWAGKIVPYDESVRVPLSIAGPGIARGTNDEIVAHIDFAPTFYDLAGIAPAQDVDGRSLLPLLRGDELPWRVDLLIEYQAPPRAIHTFEQVREVVARGIVVPFAPDYRAVRTARFSYIEWYAGPEHEYELYDMADDPYQLTNLMADPATVPAGVVADLQERLEELAACGGASCR